MKRKTKRALAVTLLLISGATLGIPIAAYSNVERERRARLYLGDRLYTEVRGSGDPVIFIAGLQGSTRYWGNTFAGLEATHRLILVDTLGFGRSPWPEQSLYTLDDQVSALRRTLVVAGATRRVKIVAHSFGTVIAAAYAAQYPHDVARIVLLGTPVFRNAEQGRARIRKMTPLAATFTFNRRLGLAGCMVVCALRPLLMRVLPYVDRNLPPAVVSDSVLHDLPAVDGAVNVLLVHPIGPLMAQLGPRATFIHGREDAVTPLGDVEELARTTGARLVILPGNHQQYLGGNSLTVEAEIGRR